jgi:hypothetical protein
MGRPPQYFRAALDMGGDLAGPGLPQRRRYAGAAGFIGF